MKELSNSSSCVFSDVFVWFPIGIVFFSYLVLELVWWVFPIQVDVITGARFIPTCGACSDVEQISNPFLYTKLGLDVVVVPSDQFKYSLPNENPEKVEHVTSIAPVLYTIKLNTQNPVERLANNKRKQFYGNARSNRHAVPHKLRNTKLRPGLRR